MAATREVFSGGPVAFVAGASGRQQGEVARFLAEFGLRNIDDLKAYIHRLETAVNLSTMVEALPAGAGEGVSIVDATGRILRVDAEFARRRGLPPEALTGRDIRRVLEEMGEMNPGRAPLPSAVDPDADRPGMGLTVIVGGSREISKAKLLARRAAATDLTVLLTGESGTGKRLFARAIHELSPRAARPFVAVNCAVVPGTATEVEMFGYAPAVFTGARKDGRPGRFEAAQRGTIFLHEVGDLTPALQAKLLRVLEEGVIERIGSAAPIPVDVRVIAASSRNLSAMAEAGRFRKDLYQRLNVLRIHLPPLRERPEDIPVLTAFIMDRYNRRYARLSPKALTAGAMALLTRYSWPGNVRELEETLRTLFALEGAREIGPEHLPPHLRELIRVSPGLGRKTLTKVVEEVEREMILEALRATGGNRAKSARLLGLPRSSFYEKLQRYDLAREAPRIPWDAAGD